MMRVIDKVRAGGLIVLVVPTQIVSKKNAVQRKLRAKMSLKAEFLGAHKLPSKTFGKYGTDTVTDIIVLRKHPVELAEKIQNLTKTQLTETNVLWDEFIEGNWFLGEGRKFIAGKYIPKDEKAILANDPDKIAEYQQKVESTMEYLFLENFLTNEESEESEETEDSDN